MSMVSALEILGLSLPQEVDIKPIDTMKANLIMLLNVIDV